MHLLKQDVDVRHDIAEAHNFDRTRSSFVTYDHNADFSFLHFSCINCDMLTWYF